MQNPINLIAESNLTRWTLDVPDDTTGIWSRDPVLKTITFSPKITDDKLGAGAKLLFQDSIAQGYNLVVLDLEPGVSYKAGLVFNYVDTANYFLFYLNQFSTGYNAYRPTIVAVQNGVGTVLYDTKVDADWVGHLTLLVEQVNGGLVFGMSNGPIFRMEGAAFLPNAACGLYSQQNDTAVFQSLVLEDQVIAANEAGRPVNIPEEKKLVESEDRFKGFLEIQPPMAETQIEFQELFTVALDSFYVSLFLNARLDPELNEGKPGAIETGSIRKRGDLVRTYPFDPHSNVELFRTGKDSYRSTLYSAHKLPAGGFQILEWNQDRAEPVWKEQTVFKDMAHVVFKSPDRAHQVDITTMEELFLYRPATTQQAVIDRGVPGSEFQGALARTILSNEFRATFSLTDYAFTVRRNSDDAVISSKTFSPRLLRPISFSPDNQHVIAYQYIFDNEGDFMEERPVQLVSIRTTDGQLTVLGDSHFSAKPEFLSPRLVAGFDENQTAVVYDIEIPGQVALFSGPYATRKSSVKLSPDGQRLIFLSADGKGIGYCATTPGAPQTLLPLDFTAKSFEVVSDDKVFLISEQETIPSGLEGCRAGFFDIQTGTFRRLNLPVDTQGIYYSPRGSGISADRTKVALVLSPFIYIIDTGSETIAFTIDNIRNNQSEAVNGDLRFTANGNRIVDTDGNNQRNISSGNWLSDEIPSGFYISTISEDGSIALLEGEKVNNGRIIKIWDVINRAEIGGPAGGGLIGNDVSISPDGKTVFYTRLSISAQADQMQLPILNEDGFIFRFSPDSSSLIFLDSVEQGNDKYRIASFRFTGSESEPDYQKVVIRQVITKRHTFDWLPNGEGFIITGDTQFELYSKNFAHVRSFPFVQSFLPVVTSPRVNALAFSDDSKFCGAIIRDSDVNRDKAMIWNVDTGAQIFGYQFGENLYTDFIALNHDGGLLALQTDNKKAIVLAIPGGEPVVELSFDESPVGCFFQGMGETAIFFFHSGTRTYQILDPEKAAAPPMERTFSYRLDYRPKNWYRGYQLARNEEKFFTDLHSKYSQIVHGLKEKLVLPSSSLPVSELEEAPQDPHVAIADTIEKMDAYRKQMGATQGRIFEYRDARQQVLHKVRTSDYALAEANPNGSFVIRNAANETLAAATSQELQNLGYDIAIVEGKPVFENFKPMTIDTSVDFNNDIEWAAFEENFRKYLFTTLTETKKSIYQSRVAELTNQGLSSEFKNQVGTLKGEIDQAGKKIGGFEAQIGSNDAAMSEWNADLVVVRTISGQLNNSGSVIDEFQKVYSKLKSTAFKKLTLYFEQSTFNSSSTASGTFGFWPFRKTLRWVVTTEHQQYTILHHYQPTAKGKLFFEHRRNPLAGQLTDSSLQEVVFFLNELDHICSRQITKLNGSNNALAEDINVQQHSIKHATDALDNLYEFGMGMLRKKFLEYWNDPDEFGALKMLANPVRPDSDPLADLLEELKQEYNMTSDSDAPEIFTDVFRFQGHQYLNGDGLTIPAYVDYVKSTGERRLAIFPQFRETGEQDPDLLRAVIHPRRAKSNFLRLPKIKFVETYLIQVSWKGYRLGELSHTENLFPGQSKEVTMERTTMLTQRREQERSASQVTTEKQTSSFEENLTKEFSQKDTEEASRESAFETEETTSNQQTENTSQTNTKNFNISANLKLGGIVGKVLGPEGTVTSGYTDNSVSSRQSSKQNSYGLSNKRSGKVASKESKESFAKEVLNTINKVSSETSRENKVEIKVRSSEEFTATQTRRETIRLENPNAGRTVNYNFFQIQNGYEVRTVLTDVKIIVDPNQEYIKGSGITDARVYELEELGKIIGDMDEDDPIQILTAAIIARQVFKNYLGSGIPGISRGNGALEIEQPFVPDTEKFRTLFFSDEEMGNGDKSYIAAVIERLRDALNYLKKTPFIFRSVPLQEPKSYSINAGAYFLDSEVGKRTALQNDGNGTDQNGTTQPVFTEADFNESDA